MKLTQSSSLLSSQAAWKNVLESRKILPRVDVWSRCVPQRDWRINKNRNRSTVFNHYVYGHETKIFLLSMEEKSGEKVDS